MIPRYKAFVEAALNRAVELHVAGSEGYYEVLDTVCDLHDMVLNLAEHDGVCRWLRERVRETDGEFYESWKEAMPALERSLPQRWTEEEDRILRECYPTMTERELAEKLGRSISAVKNRRHILGLSKPEGYVNPGQIKKGEVRYRTPKGVRNSPGTEFKKGQMPHNTKRDGYISVRHLNTGEPYFFIRVALKKWELLHRYVWQKTYGEIPPGYVIVFRDGNWQNCLPENLEMITRQELVRRNANREKQREGMLRFYATPEGKAKRLAGHDHELARWLVQHHPELLELADVTTELRRLIRKQDLNLNTNDDERSKATDR